MFSRPKQQVAVVIPVYKPEMNYFDRIAFDRCLRVLRNYPIVIAAPENLDLRNYLGRDSRIGVQRFDASNFESLSRYSRLMLSKDFYGRFLMYRYILMYQLDAFVFADDLEAWCARGYDYVGAPWMNPPAHGMFSVSTNPVSRILNCFKKRSDALVGNGGFSLRKVRTLWLCLSMYTKAARRWASNEDGFWSVYLPSIYPLFNIPSVEIAMAFSFETRPADCYRLNESRLPFGCHGWQSYDIEFWRPVFRELGYSI